MSCQTVENTDGVQRAKAIPGAGGHDLEHRLPANIREEANWGTVHLRLPDLILIISWTTHVVEEVQGVQRQVP